MTADKQNREIRVLNKALRILSNLVSDPSEALTDMPFGDSISWDVWAEEQARMQIENEERAVVFDLDDIQKVIDSDLRTRGGLQHSTVERLMNAARHWKSLAKEPQPLTGTKS